MREGVEAVLEALRESIGAEALGLFDDDRAAGAEPLNFWEAFVDLPCGALDWAGFYAGLKRERRVDTGCNCGAGHRVMGWSIHDRWVLLLVAPTELDSGAVAALSSSLRVLDEKLPPGKAPEVDAHDVPYLEHERAAAGTPVFWLRNTRQ